VVASPIQPQALPLLAYPNSEPGTRRGDEEAPPEEAQTDAALVTEKGQRAEALLAQESESVVLVGSGKTRYQKSSKELRTKLCCTCIQL